MGLEPSARKLAIRVANHSIFLLAASVDQYAEFSASFRFNKLVASSALNVIFIGAGRFILNTIPLALNFFLISLLVHLLLRGFWIGIVGLSSVSNTIDIESLKLKGPFRKRIPEKIRNLDDLIFFLDQVSSVIFAYTYLLAFSIISVMLVSAFLFSLLGVGTFFQNSVDGNQGVLILLSVLNLFLVLILSVGAVIFFSDTILFSAFKKSKWFSVLYYPIYRFFSVISLSLIYRSIYYHLITNYTKKQIISVTLVLGATLFVAYRIDAWQTYPYYPEVIDENQYIMQKGHYDDERREGYIYTGSIPSKFVKNDFLELFLRYSPNSNEVLSVLCPDFRDLERNVSLTIAMSAGAKSAKDSTLTLMEILGTDETYEALVKSSVGCLSSIYEVYIDGEKRDDLEFFFTRHDNKGERGVETVIDIAELKRGRHLITINKLDFNGNPFLSEKITEDKLVAEGLVKISFWKE